MLQFFRPIGKGRSKVDGFGPRKEVLELYDVQRRVVWKNSDMKLRLLCVIYTKILKV